MVVFARVVEAGSFSAAAKELGCSRAAVSKQIANLEREIGAQLLNRTTRRMSLTEIGSEFYARCARIAEEVSEAERIVAAMRGKPVGVLRVACPLDFGRSHLAPALPRFLAKYPDVRIHLAMSDEHSDLLRDRSDVAIRVSPHPPDSSCVVRMLGRCDHIVCASPSYLEQYGEPQIPKDLTQHTCLVYTNVRTPEVWRFRGSVAVRVRGPLAANNGSVLRWAAVGGTGLVQLPSFLVQDDLREGRLRRVLTEFEGDELGIFALYPGSQILAPKVAAFIDYLAEFYSSDWS